MTAHSPQAKYEENRIWRRVYGESQWWPLNVQDASRLAAHFEDVVSGAIPSRLFAEERAHYAQFAADIRTAIEDYERGEK